MRDNDQEGLDIVGFKFNFQMADGGGRKACSIRVDAVNFHTASAVFRQKWPITELMARQSLASLAEGEEINLVMPSIDPP
jgi:hypothetical protein